MRTKDEFRVIIKKDICMRGGGDGADRWGCPCCVPYRLVGRKNNRNLARRHARRTLKINDRKMFEEFVD